MYIIKKKNNNIMTTVRAGPWRRGVSSIIYLRIIIINIIIVV